MEEIIWHSFPFLPHHRIESKKIFSKQSIEMISIPKSDLWVCVLILITLWLMSFRDGSRFFWCYVDAVLTLLSNLTGWIVAQEIFISIFQIFWLAPIIHQSNFISFFSFFEAISSWTRKFNSIFSHTVQRNNYELSIKITVIKMQTDCILSPTSIDAVHFCFIAS